jgi:HD-GYP domain-containing protein (c-di-GMP phosphodiesterase class II)/CheY-like chemotaxis protein
MPEARILVISAAPSLTSQIVGTLSGHGYLVTTSGSLLGGVEELARSRYDALVLDETAVADRDAMNDIVTENPSVIGLLVLSDEATEDKVVAYLRDGWAEVLAQPLDQKGIVRGLAQGLKRALRVRESIRASTLTPLARISENFLLNLDLDDLLTKIVQTAQREARCDRISLMLVEDRELRIRASVGLPPGVTDSWRGQVGVGIAGHTAASGETVLINHGEEDPRFLEHLKDDKIKSAISMPLKVKSKTIGVLNLTNFMGGERFFDSDVQFLSLLSGQAAVAIENANLYNSLQTSYLHTIVSLANALEARDPYLSGHSTKVLTFSVQIARKMALSERDVDDIRNAAMLHDIGKIGVRDAILLKPGRLDDSEWKILRTHPEMGSNIIAPVRHLACCVPLILHHHESYDGTGYPSGLAGDEIPLGSRVISVADTYDAMTSDRPYRKGFTHDDAIAELKRVSGTQLDPDAVAAFLAVVAESQEDEPTA